jgi:hypothetical protein
VIYWSCDKNKEIEKKWDVKWVLGKLECTCICIINNNIISLWFELWTTQHAKGRKRRNCSMTHTCDNWQNTIQSIYLHEIGDHRFCSMKYYCLHFSSTTKLTLSRNTMNWTLRTPFLFLFCNYQSSIYFYVKLLFFVHWRSQRFTFVSNKQV